MSAAILLILFPLMVYSSVLTEEQQMLEGTKKAVEYVRQRNSSSQFYADETVCYDDLGCFSTNGPLSHIGYLPDSPEYINTRFFVYTLTRNRREIFYDDDDSLINVPLGTSLAIVIHGFGMDGNSKELLSLKDSLFSEVDTVIVTDWKKGASSPAYLSASTNTQVVGRQVALLVNNLKKSRNIKPEDVHLLGFSLGAQISGFAGKRSREAYNWKFGRITGMDAAAPLFEGYPGSHLTHEDADFVDGVHTSAGTNILAGDCGFMEPYAHVDFFPNGGKSQPRCGIFSGITCNHYSAVIYTDSSLTANCEFLAYKCTSWDEFNSGKCKQRKGDSRLGYYSIYHPGRGSHYLKTSSKYPFCNV